MPRLAPLALLLLTLAACGPVSLANPPDDAGEADAPTLAEQEAARQAWLEAHNGYANSRDDVYGEIVARRGSAPWDAFAVAWQALLDADEGFSSRPASATTAEYIRLAYAVPAAYCRAAALFPSPGTIGRMTGRPIAFPPLTRWTCAAADAGTHD